MLLPAPRDASPEEQQIQRRRTRLEHHLKLHMPLGKRSAKRHARRRLAARGCTLGAATKRNGRGILAASALESRLTAVLEMGAPLRGKATGFSKKTCSL